MFEIVSGENFFSAMRASMKFFLTKKKKKKEKKKGVAIAQWQCNAPQEFLTQKKKITMIVSVSETEKEVEEEFLRRRKSVKRAHQKRESQKYGTLKKCVGN